MKSNITFTVSATNLNEIKNSFEFLKTVPQPAENSTRKVQTLPELKDGKLVTVSVTYTDNATNEVILGYDVVELDRDTLKVYYTGNPKDFGSGDVGWFMGKKI